VARSREFKAYTLLARLSRWDQLWACCSQLPRRLELGKRRQKRANKGSIRETTRILTWRDGSCACGLFWVLFFGAWVLFRSCVLPSEKCAYIAPLGYHAHLQGQRNRYQAPSLTLQRTPAGSAHKRNGHQGPLLVQMPHRQGQQNEFCLYTPQVTLGTSHFTSTKTTTTKPKQKKKKRALCVEITIRLFSPYRPVVHFNSPQRMSLFVGHSFCLIYL
jgi:hypothetical protein